MTVFGEASGCAVGFIRENNIIAGIINDGPDGRNSRRSLFERLSCEIRDRVSTGNAYVSIL